MIILIFCEVYVYHAPYYEIFSSPCLFFLDPNFIFSKTLNLSFAQDNTSSYKLMKNNKQAYDCTSHLHGGR